jgi:hypothetical protein
MAATNMLSTAGESAKESAEALRKLTPEQWSNSDAYQELRASGLNHKDSVAILAPIFALPAQTTGAAAGYLAGRIGAEEMLAGRAVGAGVRGRGARALSELGTEQVETIAPKVVGNIVTGTMDEGVSPVSGLGQAIVETAAGTVPGAALAASGRARPAEPPAAVPAEPAAVEPEAPPAPAERIEPTFEERAVPAIPEPAGRVEPTLEGKPAAPEERRRPATAQQIEELKATLPFLSDAEAAAIIEAREARAQVDAERRAAIEPPAMRAPEAADAQSARLQELYDDAIVKGASPEQAITVAREQLAIEQQEAVGEERVAETVTAPSGEGVSVAGQPPAGTPTGGLAGAERAGVVPAEADVGQPPAREGEQPGAVTPKVEETLEEADARFAAEDAAYQKQVDEDKSTGQFHAQTAFDQRGAYKDLDDAIDSYRENLADTLSEQGITDPNRFNVTLDAFNAEVAKLKAAEAPTAPPKIELAPIEPPKSAAKRGRPKAELTPEQQAEKAAQRKATQGALIKADREVKKLVSTIDKAAQPLDESQITDEEALIEARNERAANRRGAIRRLLELEPQFRGTALGNRIKTALARPDIKPQELADIKRGIEATKRALGDKGVSSAIFAEGVFPVNPSLSKAKNANQALSAIIATGSPFQRMLARRLRGLVNNTRFVVLEEGQPLPDELKKFEKSWQRANGMYVPSLNTVYVRGASAGRAQGVNNVTALHEILHAATVRKIGFGTVAFARASRRSPELQRFVAELVSTMDLAKAVYDRRLAAKTLSPEVRSLVERTNGEVFDDPMEFLAYGMSDPDFQLFLMRVPGRIKDETAFSRFVRAIMDLFGIGPRDYSAFSDLVNVTDRILAQRTTPIMEAFEPSQPLLQRDEKLAEQEGIRSAKKLKKDMDKALEGLRKSKASELHKHQGALQKLRDQNPVSKAIDVIYSKADYKTKQVLANAPSFDFVARWTQKELPMIGDAYVVVQKMLGHMAELRETAVSQVQMLDRDFRKNKGLEEKLNDILPVVTIMEVDPSQSDALEREKRLDAMYKGLGEEGQKPYKRVIDYHANLRDYQEYLLDKMIKDLPGLDENTKKNMLARIYAKFQDERRIEPYLPLIRDPGDFFLAVGEGDNVQIYTYETREQRQEDAERIAREDYGGKPVGQLLETQEFAMINEPGELRRSLDIRNTLLSELFNAIDSRVPEAGKAGESFAAMNEQLKNDMFDIWLAAMPEQAFRKQFMNRKNRPGYRPDIKRNIASHIARMAPALARLRYGNELRSEQIRLREAVRVREDLTPFKQSVDERINGVMNPQGASMWDSVAGAANKLTYLTYLTGAATAFLQPMSIYISALPILIANHGANPARVAAALAKNVGYMKQYGIVKTMPDGTTKYVAPSLANSKMLTPDEQRAVKAMTSMNVSQQTYAGFLWDAAAGREDDIVQGKGAKAADFLLNALLRNTERLTREVVYLSSYQLGRKRGLSEQEAILQAAADVKESLGDYDLAGRPTWMQGPFGRILFSMKMYPLVVTQQLFGNMYRMIPGLNKEGKKEAFIKFSGIVMTTASIAGVYNMPFADLLITMLTKFLGEQDEDELPEGLKQKDPVLWFKTVFMPEQLGRFSVGGVPLDVIIGEGPLTALTGRAIGQRIGLNDLWFRDGKPSPDLVTSMQAFAFSFFPLASYSTSLLKAFQDFAIGDYQRAMERAVPLATARNFLVAERIKKEGFETPGGKQVQPEDVTTADLVWQRMGFSPADVQFARDSTFKLTGVQQQIMIQRNQLVNKLKFAARKEDYDSLDEIREEEVADFNERNPDYKLTGAQIREILKEDREKREKARAGMTIDKKNRALFEESVENVERRLERRLEK